MEFHEKLAQLLKERVMSQSDLARRMKVGRSAVNSWVTGRY